jgi:MFS family permease
MRERVAGLTGPLARGFVVVAATMSADSLVHFLFPPYLDSLGFPVDLIGFLMALASLASLVSRLPAGMVYRGSRARALIVGALVIAILTTLAIPFVHDPLLFGVLRVIIGLAYGVVTTTNLARFIEAVPPGTNRPRAMGYYAAALAVGLVIGNGVGGFVAEWFGYLVAFQSAVAFYLVALAVALALPAPPRRTVLAHAAHRPAAPRTLGARLAALRDPGLVTVASAAMLIAFMQMISGAFLPLYGLSVGLAIAEIATVRAAGSLTNVFGRAGAGPLTQRLGRHRAQHVGIALQAAGVVGYSFCTTFWPLLAAMLWVSVWRSIVLVANTIALTEDVPEERISRGLSSGIYNAATDVGQIIAPALGGVVAAAFGLETMLRLLPPAVLAVYLLVAFGATRLAPASAPRPVASPER